MSRAFAATHGRPEALAQIALDGMTDRLIVRQGLVGIGAEASESAIDGVLAAYLGVLAEECAQVEPERYRVHRGMREAIAVASRTGAAIGLGTGNIREGARIKLERVELHAHFAFGGFGNDAEDRTQLIRIGADRGAAALGKERGACRVVVIGDTPRDAAAAAGIGAECIAVATGRFTISELRAAGADYVFADLTEERALEALLEGRGSAVALTT